MTRRVLMTGVIAVLLLAQIGLTQVNAARQPALEVVPPAPSAEAMQALSLGDSAFYFRSHALHLQNFGDSYGRFTPLKDYDYARLQRWMQGLDTLAPNAHFLPALASYYFSQTQHTPDIRYMVDFLYRHSMRDVPDNWWWLLQANYLARHKLKDLDLSLKVAQPLIHPKVPAWAQQMVAITQYNLGEYENALHIMQHISTHAEQFTDNDLKYMQYFIKERLEALEEIQ